LPEIHWTFSLLLWHSDKCEGDAGQTAYRKVNVKACRGSAFTLDNLTKFAYTIAR
jgi:hypothetical protein